MIAASPTRAPAAHRFPGGAIISIRNCTIFVAVCVVFCAAIRSRLPFPDVPVLRTKLDYYALGKERYDALFIGSSRFFHQIIPAEFDRIVSEETGTKFASFNISCDALWPPESYYFLRKILAIEPARRRWVFIELMDIHPFKNGTGASGTADNPKDDNGEVSIRDAYWHDWQHTKMACGAVQLLQKPTPLSKFSLMLGHVSLMFQQWANIGRGAEWFNAVLGPRRNTSDPFDEWRVTEGYRSEPDKGKVDDDYAAAVEHMRRDKKPKSMTPLFHDAVAKIAVEVRAAGVEPIFVVTPTINPNERYGDLPSGYKLFSYVDPDEYPELYNPDTHFDDWHLNDKGAAEFTRTLASEFASYLNSAGTRGKSAPPEKQ